MSRILIVSDSHGSREILKQLKKTHGEEVDLMIHCGDSELLADDPAIDGFAVVRGNCDFVKDFPNEQLLEIEGRKILVTHGHLHSIKSTLSKLLYRAQELGADVACFGHSHQLGAETVEDILLVNPGSIRLPRGRTEKTYVILDLEENQAVLHVYDYGKGEMAELKRTYILPKKR